MPYTRETRIEVLNKKYSKRFRAQVKYRVPFTKFSYWKNFHEIEPSFIRYLCGFGNPLAYKAEQNCLWDEERSKLKALDWAKVVIDEYHKLFDEQEHVETVDYIKYP